MEPSTGHDRQHDQRVEHSLHRIADAVASIADRLAPEVDDLTPLRVRTPAALPFEEWRAIVAGAPSLRQLAHGVAGYFEHPASEKIDALPAYADTPPAPRCPNAMPGQRCGLLSCPICGPEPPVARGAGQLDAARYTLIVAGDSHDFHVRGLTRAQAAVEAMSPGAEVLDARLDMPGVARGAGAQLEASARDALAELAAAVTPLLGRLEEHADAGDLNVARAQAALARADEVLGA